MNILYLADTDITINKGGVNRVTHFLSRKFMQIPGWHCYLAYLYESNVLPVSDFDDKIKLDKINLQEQLKSFIVKNDIHIVIINLTVKKNIFLVLPELKKISSQLPHLHSIFCFHTYPGYELSGINFKDGISRLLYSPERLKTLKFIIMDSLCRTPLKSLLMRYIAPKYKFIYDHCDKLILLSPHYIPEFAQYANISSPSKMDAIPNPLSFEENLPPEKLIDKQKEILIVSRLSERQKRLTLALKIWQQIEQDKASDGWRLIVVGEGEDGTYYRKLAQKLNLKNISFEGRQAPIQYYQRASVFLMTSLYEGFPLTLVEAQQLGVVPMAFNGFTSVYDIIQNEKNGLIIQEKNTQQFISQLIWLMNHAKEREDMAHNGLQSSQQFCMENIFQQWCKLFERLQNEA